MDAAVHVWLNVGVIFVVAGAAMYLSLWNYME